MKVLRVVIIVLIFIAVILLLYSFLIKPGQAPGSTDLPLDLRTIIPASWSVVPGQFKNCDFDGDGEDEYLVIYRYDPPAPPSGVLSSTLTAQVIADRSLIGGAIFDTQVIQAPQSPGTPAPYRPAFLVPYKLLPDIYGSNGQGNLGQSDVKLIYLPGGDSTKKQCKGKEIVIYGYDQDKLPTSLGIFRWAGESDRYDKAYFQADTRVQAYGPNGSLDVLPDAKAPKPVMDVFTFNQRNQRSLLCSVHHYFRTSAPGSDGLPPELKFEERVDDATIDFCYGPPKDPTYPEGVVVALLRGQNPNDDTPTHGSYFMPEATIAPELPAALAELEKSPRKPLRVLSLDVPGSLGSYPPLGTGWNPPVPGWWQSSDTAPVNAEIVLGDQTVQVRFTLVSIANEKANTDLRWRITRIELR